MCPKEPDYDEVVQQIDDLMKELEKSELVKGLSIIDKDDILYASHQFMEVGCNYCCEQPRDLKGMHIVKEIMLEWVPRKVGGDDDYWRIFPDGVILALRFLGGKYNWGNTPQLIEWVDKNRAGFIKEVNDPRNFGMAKAMVMMMQRDGVDITDKKAADKWIANYNLSRQMETMGLEEEDDDDPLMQPIKNFTPKTSRNAPCPCGSGKKYKKCCGRNAGTLPAKPKPPVPVIKSETSEYNENSPEPPLAKNYDVPLEEWRALYEAAIQFKNLSPWEWILEDEMFGVQDPATGQIGYISIMGNLGEHLALAVYPGSDGLASWQEFRKQAEQKPQGKTSLLDAAQMMMLQKCLMVSFEDRAELTKEDLQIIQTLGLKFKGSQSWPLFRNYSPGYFPWYLIKDEVKYLTLVLLQAMEVAQRIQKEGTEILEGPERSQYLVRVHEKEGEALRPDGNRDFTSLRWLDKWLTPAPIIQPELKPTIDKDRLDQLKTAKPLKRGIWELDFFFLPTPVNDENDKRPFYPYNFMCLDRAADYIVGTVFAKVSDYIPKFTNGFLDCLENAKILPIEICVRKDEAYQCLSPITQALGIQLTRAKKLPVLNKAVTAMLNHLQV